MKTQLSSFTEQPCTNISRRQMLGFTKATLLILAIGSKAKAHPGNTSEVQQNILKIESGPGQIVTAEFAHHHHFLEIPLEYIENPPAEGLKLHTGWSKFRNPLVSVGSHFHSVIISQANLLAVKEGQTVIVEDTVKDHKYMLKLP
ncbi:MAG: hypothetical protein ACXVCP_02545 [Bdellovibrio sp.]